MIVLLSETMSYVIMAIVLLHIGIGFGYLMYKLSSKKGGDKDDSSESS